MECDRNPAALAMASPRPHWSRRGTAAAMREGSLPSEVISIQQIQALGVNAADIKKLTDT